MDTTAKSIGDLQNVLYALQTAQITIPSRERALAITKIEEAIHWLEVTP